MDVLKYLEECAALVEPEIDRWLPRQIQPEVLTKAMRHLIEAGGKRLRPCLALTACEAVGGKREDAIETAAALELFHNFTLIHDDIMDHDEFRRNVKTVHVLWGEPIAIIAGDALFAKVFEAAAANASRLGMSREKTVELFNTLSRASFELCQGQALDMLFEKRNDVTEEEYMQMISGKTGALTEAATKAGALLGNASAAEIQALSRYGRLIGIAFQMQDDVLGILGKQEKFGKPIGSDIREGKKTLIIVKALDLAPGEERRVLLRAFGRSNATDEEIREAIAVLKRVGAVDYVAERARKMVAEAKMELKILPDSRAKEALLGIADFVVEREF
ncbi:MAG: polyprenyl synthetase family protein [Candidatus Hadarchaeum sp.]|uniref:polyprenyl synthetase family protein n=1 Tax=Candidatus Hadarchaeum sp. TaxID=2883567 RepID=UPI003D125E2F